MRGRLVAAALVIGVSIGAFITYDADAPVGGAAAARRSEDRVAVLQRAVDDRPEDAAAWRELAVAYVARAAEVGDPTFYGPAREAVDAAEALEPGAPETAVARGGLALALHDFPGALSAADAAIAVRRLPGALLVRVDALVELGRYDDATVTLQELLDVRPSLPALARVSYLRQLHGDAAGALAAARRSETAGTGDPVSVATIVTIQGDLLLERGELERARAAYEQALDLAPTLNNAELGLARVEIADREPGALARLEALVERVPSLGGAILLVELDPSPANIEGLRNVGRQEEEIGASVDLELARLEADHGDPSAAVPLAAAALARPTVHASDAMGWALHRAGRTAEALPHVEAALRLGTTDPVPLVHAAAVRAALGDEARASEDLRRAFASDPWMAPGIRTEGRRLAAVLDLEVPVAWR